MVRVLNEMSAFENVNKTSTHSKHMVAKSGSHEEQFDEFTELALSFTIKEKSRENAEAMADALYSFIKKYPKKASKDILDKLRARLLHVFEYSCQVNNISHEWLKDLIVLYVEAELHCQGIDWVVVNRTKDVLLKIFSRLYIFTKGTYDAIAIRYNIIQFLNDELPYYNVYEIRFNRLINAIKLGIVKQEKSFYSHGLLNHSTASSHNGNQQCITDINVITGITDVDLVTGPFKQFKDFALKDPTDTDQKLIRLKERLVRIQNREFGAECMNKNAIISGPVEIFVPTVEIIDLSKDEEKDEVLERLKHACSEYEKVTGEKVIWTIQKRRTEEGRIKKRTIKRKQRKDRSLSVNDINCIQPDGGECDNKVDLSTTFQGATDMNSAKTAALQNQIQKEHKVSVANEIPIEPITADAAVQCHLPHVNAQDASIGIGVKDKVSLSNKAIQVDPLEKESFPVTPRVIVPIKKTPDGIDTLLKAADIVNNIKPRVSANSFEAALDSPLNLSKKLSSKDAISYSDMPASACLPEKSSNVENVDSSDSEINFQIRAKDGGAGSMIIGKSRRSRIKEKSDVDDDDDDIPLALFTKNRQPQRIAKCPTLNKNKKTNPKKRKSNSRRTFANSKSNKSSPLKKRVSDLIRKLEEQIVEKLCDSGDTSFTLDSSIVKTKMKPHILNALNNEQYNISENGLSHIAKDIADILKRESKPRSKGNTQTSRLVKRVFGKSRRSSPTAKEMDKSTLTNLNLPNKDINAYINDGISNLTKAGDVSNRGNISPETVHHNYHNKLVKSNSEGLLIDDAKTPVVSIRHSNEDTHHSSNLKESKTISDIQAGIKNGILPDAQIKNPVVEQTEVHSGINEESNILYTVSPFGNIPSEKTKKASEQSPMETYNEELTNNTHEVVEEESKKLEKNGNIENVEKLCGEQSNDTVVEKHDQIKGAIATAEEKEQQRDTLSINDNIEIVINRVTPTTELVKGGLAKVNEQQETSFERNNVQAVIESRTQNIEVAQNYTSSIEIKTAEIRENLQENTLIEENDNGVVEEGKANAEIAKDGQVDTLLGNNKIDIVKEFANSEFPVECQGEKVNKIDIKTEIGLRIRNAEVAGKYRDETLLADIGNAETTANLQEDTLIEKNGNGIVEERIANADIAEDGQDDTLPENNKTGIVKGEFANSEVTVEWLGGSLSEVNEMNIETEIGPGIRNAEVAGKEWDESLFEDIVNADTTADLQKDTLIEKNDSGVVTEGIANPKITEDRQDDSLLENNKLKMAKAELAYFQITEEVSSKIIENEVDIKSEIRVENTGIAGNEEEGALLDKDIANIEMVQREIANPTVAGETDVNALHKKGTMEGELSNTEGSNSEEVESSSTKCIIDELYSICNKLSENNLNDVNATGQKNQDYNNSSNIEDPGGRTKEQNISGVKKNVESEKDGSQTQFVSLDMSSKNEMERDSSRPIIHHHESIPKEKHKNCISDQIPTNINQFPNEVQKEFEPFTKNDIEYPKVGAFTPSELQHTEDNMQIIANNQCDEYPGINDSAEKEGSALTNLNQITRNQLIEPHEKGLFPTTKSSTVEHDINNITDDTSNVSLDPIPVVVTDSVEIYTEEGENSIDPLEFPYSECDSFDLAYSHEISITDQDAKITEKDDGTECSKPDSETESIDSLLTNEFLLLNIQKNSQNMIPKEGSPHNTSDPIKISNTNYEEPSGSRGTDENNFCKRTHRKETSSNHKRANIDVTPFKTKKVKINQDQATRKYAKGKSLVKYCIKNSSYKKMTNSPKSNLHETKQALIPNTVAQCAESTTTVKETGKNRVKHIYQNMGGFNLKNENVTMSTAQIDLAGTTKPLIRNMRLTCPTQQTKRRMSINETEKSKFPRLCHNSKLNGKEENFTLPGPNVIVEKISCPVGGGNYVSREEYNEGSATQTPIISISSKKSTKQKKSPAKPMQQIKIESCKSTTTVLKHEASLAELLAEAAVDYPATNKLPATVQSAIHFSANNKLKTACNKLPVSNNTEQYGEADVSKLSKPVKMYLPNQETNLSDTIKTETFDFQTDFASGISMESVLHCTEEVGSQSHAPNLKTTCTDHSYTFPNNSSTNQEYPHHTKDVFFLPHEPSRKGITQIENNMTLRWDTYNDEDELASYLQEPTVQSTTVCGVPSLDEISDYEGTGAETRLPHDDGVPATLLHEPKTYTSTSPPPSQAELLDDKVTAAKKNKSTKVKNQKKKNIGSKEASEHSVRRTRSVTQNLKEIYPDGIDAFDRLRESNTIHCSSSNGDRDEEKSSDNLFPEGVDTDWINNMKKHFV